MAIPVPQKSTPEPEEFDFGRLPVERAERLRFITMELRREAIIAHKAIIALGEWLAEAQAVCEGFWGEYLKFIGWKSSTANNYINAAKHWRDNPQVLKECDLESVFILSTSKVPAGVRDDFLQLVKRGEHIDDNMARALRDAPSELRARYVIGLISAEQFINLVRVLPEVTGHTDRAAMVRKLVRERITDSRVVSRLFQDVPDNVVQEAVVTGYFYFDERAVPAENLTRELLQAIGWKFEPPPDEPSGSNVKPVIDSDWAMLVAIDPTQRTATFRLTEDLGVITEGIAYRLKIFEQVR